MSVHKTLYPWIIIHTLDYFFYETLYKAELSPTYHYQRYVTIHNQIMKHFTRVAVSSWRTCLQTWGTDPRFEMCLEGTSIGVCMNICMDMRIGMCVGICSEI